MGKVEVKNGLAPVFVGAVVGVAILVIVNLVLTATSSEGLKLIPTLTFAGDLFPFIKDYFSFFFTTALGLIVVGATLLFYIVASIFVGDSKPEPPDYPNDVENLTAGLMRGLSIGVSSAMNFALAENIYGTWFGSASDHSAIGLIIAFVLFTLGILSSIKAVSQSGFFQGVIGWLNWFSPMSWPIQLLGLLLALISIVPFGIIGIWWDAAKLGGDKAAGVDASVQGNTLTADWSSGTFFLIGGLVANLHRPKTAFDTGNIGFIHREANYDYRRHEGGHNLSVFAFGWIFSLYGAVDDVFRADNAYTERLADGRGRVPGTPTLDMWA
jgi:hypothetical protein